MKAKLSAFNFHLLIACNTHINTLLSLKEITNES